MLELELHIFSLQFEILIAVLKALKEKTGFGNHFRDLVMSGTEISGEL